MGLWHDLLLLPLVAAPTCTILADNGVYGLYVDGVSQATSGGGTTLVTIASGRLSWPTKRSLSFSDSASLLAILVRDNEAGCVNGGLMIQCTATASANAARWSIDSRSTSGWLVYTRNNDWTGPSNDAAGNSWYSSACECMPRTPRPIPWCRSSEW